MKNKNIHILPTDKPSRLIKIYNEVDKKSFALKLDIEVNDNFKEYQHIYITSNEKPKDGDWLLIIDDFETYVHKHKGDNLPTTYYKKIILTTDQDLIADGVQAIDDEFLEWFVKNPSCEEVEVTDYFNPKNIVYGHNTEPYKIIIPQEEPKLDTVGKQFYETADMTITVKRQKQIKQLAEEEYWMKDEQYERGAFVNGYSQCQNNMLEFLETEIKRAYQYGQTNAQMMEAGLERDEVEEYVNFRMLSFKNK
jgi:hypothetical protein